MSDQARADEFLRRQVVLTWVAALVVLVTLSAVALALFLVPAASRAWATAAAAVGAGVVAVLFAVLLRHAVRLAGFAFRKELS
jgi:membrane protein YdbS with pleckstrin-like domain